jgi:hypothetical protein
MIHVSYRLIICLDGLDIAQLTHAFFEESGIVYTKEVKPLDGVDSHEF